MLASIGYPGFLVGVGLFTILLVYHGVREVGAALAAAGWGLMVVASFHVVPLVSNVLGWRVLLRRAHPARLRTLVWARWIGEAVNALLPVMQIGGNVVRASVLARRGVPAATAGATVVVDITLNVVAQILFTLFGLGLLLVQLGGSAMIGPLLVGTTMMGLMLSGFYVAQHQGLFSVLTRFVAPIGRRLDWRGFTSEAAALDATVIRLYKDRRAVVATSGWHVLSWFAGAGEVWLALYFLGSPVTIVTAILIESLGQALRTAAFAVPGALGIQEGGYLMLGGVLGLSPETSLALSLAKRVRELFLGVPGLVAWQLESATTLLN